MMRGVWIGVVLSVLLGATSAQAAPSAADKKQAEQLFRAGDQAFKAGKYEDAANAFEQAYGLFPLPPILFATAQAHRLQYVIDKRPERLKRAVVTYRRYLREVKSGGRRKEAVDNLSKLEPELTRLEQERGTIGQMAPAASQTQFIISVVPTSVKGAMVSIDGGKKLPLPHIPTLKPGKHKVEITAPGYFDYEGEKVAVDGRIIPVEVTLKPKPATVVIKAASGSEVFLDGRKVGEANESLEVPVGEHLLAVTGSGRRPWAREVALQRDQKLSLQADQPRTFRRKAAYWVIGIGAAATIVGATYGGLAISSYSQAGDIDDKRKSMGITQAEFDEYLSLRDEYQGRRNISLLVGGAGLAVLTTGLVMYWFDTPAASEAVPQKYRPQMDDEGADPADPEGPRNDGIDQEAEDIAKELDVSLVPGLWNGGGGVVINGKF